MTKIVLTRSNADRLTHIHTLTRDVAQYVYEMRAAESIGHITSESHGILTDNVMTMLLEAVTELHQFRVHHLK